MARTMLQQDSVLTVGLVRWGGGRRPRVSVKTCLKDSSGV